MKSKGDKAPYVTTLLCVCVCFSLSLSLPLHRLLRTSPLRQPWLPSLPSSWSSPMACREAWYAFTSFPLFSLFSPFILFFHLFVGRFLSYRNLADRCLVSLALIDCLPFFRLLFFSGWSEAWSISPWEDPVSKMGVLTVVAAKYILPLVRVFVEGFSSSC